MSVSGGWYVYVQAEQERLAGHHDVLEAVQLSVGDRLLHASRRCGGALGILAVHFT